MDAYHIDRFGQLHLNQCVNSDKCLGEFPSQLERFIREHYPQGLSRFGREFAQRIFDLPLSGLGPQHYDTVIERDFEEVRLKHFSDIPSRFVCVFACEGPSDVLKYWNELLIPGARVWRITSKYDGRIFDSSFLKCYSYATGYKLSEATPGYKEICKYWQGMISRSPRPELLIPLPFFVAEDCTADILQMHQR